MKVISTLPDAVIATGRSWGLPGVVEPTTAFTTPSGNVLMSDSFTGMGEKYGEPLVSIVRDDLQQVLERHAARVGVEVRRGVSVAGFRDDGSRVDALDEHGASIAEGDVLVGADGLRSKIRRQLLDDGEPEFRGFTAVRGFGPISPEYPGGGIVYGDGLILFSSPIDADRVYWVASIAAKRDEWPPLGAERAYDELRRRLSGWHPALASPVVDAVDTERMVVTDIFDRDPVSEWSRGRVTLLGDAAHPMVYTMGQGANQALEDAAVLAHELATSVDVSAALVAYQNARAERVGKVVKQSRMFGSIGHVKGPVAGWFRDTMMRVMSRFQRSDAVDPVMAWQPPAPAS